MIGITTSYEKYLWSVCCGLLNVSVPLLAAAQVLPNSPTLDPPFVVNRLCSVAGWLFTFLVVFSIVAVLFAAFGYLFAMGDPEKVKLANRKIIFAAVAIVVGLFAKGVPTLVASVLGTSIAPQC